MTLPLDQWFHVMIDEEYVSIYIDPPDGEVQRRRIRWDSIIRVCFRPADFLGSDEILLFVEGRDESYLIPLEVDGGFELWDQIIDRELFDAELAIKLATSSDEEFHCWPSGEEE